MDKHTCPRRAEDGMDRTDVPFRNAGPNLDTWDVRGVNTPPRCSYCGSVQPRYFLDQLKAGVELGVTDKDYKSYLPGNLKFYYQHMEDMEDRREFAAMLSRDEVRFGYPGRFTVLPFFLTLHPRHEGGN